MRNFLGKTQKSSSTMQGFISVTSKIYRQSKQASRIKEMKMTEIQEKMVQAIDQMKNSAPINYIKSS